MIGQFGQGGNRLLRSQKIQQKSFIFFLSVDGKTRKILAKNTILR
jgi:hypothetical protein